MIKEVIDSILEGKPSLTDTYNKIKDFDIKALMGYARKIGLDDEIVDPYKRSKNTELLMDEILGYLFDDNWEMELINKKVI